MFRFVAVSLFLLGCSDTYVRQGVTDGDTFFLAPLAHTSDDPVVASWVRYSLVRSACQLAIDGENPARSNSYECEIKARHQLVEAWRNDERAASSAEGEYLNTLARVVDAGYLKEYTAHYLVERGWKLPSDIRADAFNRWRRQHLQRHRPRTRLIGYWGYRRALAETR